MTLAGAALILAGGVALLVADRYGHERRTRLGGGDVHPTDAMRWDGWAEPAWVSAARRGGLYSVGVGAVLVVVGLAA